MLKFSEQELFEQWLRRCPLGTAGLKYGVTRRNDSTITVQVECEWVIDCRSLKESPQANATSTMDAACAVRGVIDASDSRASTIQLAVCQRDEGGSSSEQGLQPPQVKANNVTEMATGTSAEYDYRSQRVFPGAHGARSSSDFMGALMALHALEPSDCASRGTCSHPPSAEAVRALLGQSLGTTFPKPPGFSPRPALTNSTETEANRGDMVVDESNKS